MCPLHVTLYHIVNLFQNDLAIGHSTNKWSGVCLYKLYIPVYTPDLKNLKKCRELIEKQITTSQTKVCEKLIQGQRFY